MLGMSGLLGSLAGGCVASPIAPPGFADLRHPTPGQVDVGADAGVLGIQSLGWSTGGSLRVAPHVRQRWSVPIEAAAFGAVSESGLSHGQLRVGVRHRLRPWLAIGGGLIGNATLEGDQIGLGGGGDVELVAGRSWERFAISGVLRPGVSTNGVTTTTLWLPSGVAFGWHATPRVTVFGSVFAAGGLAVAGPFGLLVGGGGASLGVTIRLGPRDRGERNEQ